MSDNELCLLMAQTWVMNGGDRTGFCYCEKRILDNIDELEAIQELE